MMCLLTKVVHAQINHSGTSASSLEAEEAICGGSGIKEGGGGGGSVTMALSVVWRSPLSFVSLMAERPKLNFSMHQLQEPCFT